MQVKEALGPISDLVHENNDWTHVVDTDPNRALCGEDVTGTEWRDSGLTCPDCLRLEQVLLYKEFFGLA